MSPSTWNHRCRLKPVPKTSYARAGADSTRCFLPRRYPRRTSPSSTRIPSRRPTLTRWARFSSLLDRWVCSAWRDSLCRALRTAAASPTAAVLEGPSGVTFHPLKDDEGEDSVIQNFHDHPAVVTLTVPRRVRVPGALSRCPYGAVRPLPRFGIWSLGDARIDDSSARSRVDTGAGFEVSAPKIVSSADHCRTHDPPDVVTVPVLHFDP